MQAEQLEGRSTGGQPVGAHARAVARVGDPAGAVALGTTTKSASASELVDVETGEIVVEHDVYAKWAEQAAARSALPGHRLQVCMRHIRQDRGEVDVLQSKKSKRAYFAGVMACGSVWVCPVCARKIQAVRAAEVRAAIDAAKARGWRVAMLTQTVRHSRQDSLKTLLSKFTEALRRFKGPRAYRRLSEAHGIRGSIRALEVTWGEVNGWHPHSHTLIFYEHGKLADLEAGMRDLWADAVERVGLPQGNEHALVVGDASDVEEYLTKMASQSYRWGPEDELVKAHSKKARGSRFTPFDFLRSHLEAPSKRMLALFAEFANSFHGRRQLVWSRGLKQELLGNDGPSDQEIAESIGENDELLAHIPLEIWVHIRRHNLQRVVLEVADHHGKDGLLQLLELYGRKVRNGTETEEAARRKEARPHDEIAEGAYRSDQSRRVSGAGAAYGGVASSGVFDGTRA